MSLGQHLLLPISRLHGSFGCSLSILSLCHFASAQDHGQHTAETAADNGQDTAQKADQDGDDGEGEVVGQGMAVVDRTRLEGWIERFPLTLSLCHCPPWVAGVGFPSLVQSHGKDSGKDADKEFQDEHDQSEDDFGLCHTKHQSTCPNSRSGRAEG